MKKKIALISDSRCSHGIYLPVLEEINNSSDFEYIYIVTGTHLSENFGETINEIKDQGYTIHYTFGSSLTDSNYNQTKNISEFIDNLLKIFSIDRPDFILAQGDRTITLAAAIVGSYLRIPVAHMHGGEISGTIDESARHAITKLSHIHFAATTKSAERILRLGEENFRVHIAGSTSVEKIKNYVLELKELDIKNILQKYGLNDLDKFLIVLQHSVSGQENESGKQIISTLEAVAEVGLPTLLIYPNSDPGNEEIIKNLKEYSFRNNLFIVKKNVPYLDYLVLLSKSSCLIGNSSGGIVEAPSLGLPVINIGGRQIGRERAKNIIDVKHDKEEIKTAIKKSLFDEDFKEIVKKCETPYNPYNNHKASKIILDVLRKIEVNNILDKKMTY